MSYGNEHETSYLRTYAFSGGARGARERSSLLRSLRTPPLPDTFSQCSRRARTTDSQKPGVRTANSARRHPRLQQARAGCSQSDLLATHRGLHAAFDEQSGLSLRELLHRSPREFGRQSTLWTLKDAAEVTFEEGLTNELVSGETIRATLSRLGVRWERAKRWIQSTPEKGARDRLILLAESHPQWALGFEDETWFSRFERPALRSWSDATKPIRLLEPS